MVGLVTAKDVGILLGRGEGCIGGDGCRVNAVDTVDVDGGELVEQGSLFCGREGLVE